MSIAPHVLEFSCDDEEAGRALSALYHAAPETDLPPTLRYSLSGTGGRYVARSPSRPPFGPTSLEEAWAFVEWRAIEDVLNDPGPDAVFVHAAGVRVGGRLLLLVGPSGSGKTTLAAALLSRGHPVLGDDVLRFAPTTGEYSAFPRSFKLDDNTLTVLELWRGSSLDEVPGTFLALGCLYVSPVALCHAWLAEPGRPWGVVVLNPGPREGAARLESFSEGQAAVRVVQSMLGASTGPGAGARVNAGLGLVESVAQARAFRVGGLGVLATADLVEEAARS